MPGIVGLITNQPRAQAEAQLNRMVEALRHESFYKIGTWIDECQGVYAGWVLRNSHDNRELPLRNPNGASLVLSGEDFSGHSKPFAQYQDDTAQFLRMLNGRFQGVLTGCRQHRATVFNDRYGIHRLYYHESQDAFYFAAEAKAILAVRPELRRINQRALGEFLSCGCVLENRSIFEGIGVLPPGSAWSFENGVLAKKGVYFEPREWEEQSTLDPESYYQELRAVYSRNLPRYFEGSEAIGMSLTGGLDTRMIMAWRHDPPGKLPCYSFGGPYRECADVTIARKVAKAADQPYEVIGVGQEFFSKFAQLAERAVYLSDGCTAVNRAADLFANQKARHVAPVRMTGNYGGEVLRRVRAFKPVRPNPELFQPELLSQIDAAATTYQGLLQGHPLSFAVFRQAPWHHYGLLALEETQVALRSPFLDNDFVQTVFKAPQSVLSSNDISFRLIRDGDARMAAIPTDRGLGGNGRWYAQAVNAYIEFTVKAEYAYDYGMPQWLAKLDSRFAPLHLERLFLGKHKFCHYRVWYRDALANYVKEILLDSRTLSRPYLRREALEATVNGHLRGEQNHTTAIHSLLTLELLHRLFIDGN